MKFPQYNMTARLYPSVIVLIPFVVFFLNADIEKFKKIITEILKFNIVIGEVSIAIVLIYLMMQINRLIGKLFFERFMFNYGQKMPATLFLLLKNNDEFSIKYKEKIRQKIKDDFKIELPQDKKKIQQNIRENFKIECPQDKKKKGKDTLFEIKRQIAEAVGLIRHYVGDGKLALQHLAEYGFGRNLAGGSIIGYSMSVCNIFYFFYHNKMLVGWISVCTAGFFIIILLTHNTFIIKLGNLYAKVLYQEYCLKK